MAQTRIRITYATMSADNEELHQAYDQAIQEAKGMLGATIPIVVNGEERSADFTYELRSPIDRELLDLDARRPLTASDGPLSSP